MVQSYTKNGLFLIRSKKKKKKKKIGNSNTVSKITENRSSRSEVFCKEGVLRNLAKFTGKYLC